MRRDILRRGAPALPPLPPPPLLLRREDLSLSRPNLCIRAACCWTHADASNWCTLLVATSATSIERSRPCVWRHSLRAACSGLRALTSACCSACTKRYLQE